MCEFLCYEFASNRVNTDVSVPHLLRSLSSFSSAQLLQRPQHSVLHQCVMQHAMLNGVVRSSTCRCFYVVTILQLQASIPKHALYLMPMRYEEVMFNSVMLCELVTGDI